MFVKLGSLLIILPLAIYLIYKVFVQNAFVVNKRLSKVRTDKAIVADDDKDIIDNYIESGKLYNIPLIGKFYQKQIEALKIANIQMEPKEYLLASIGLFSVFLLIGGIATGKILLGLVLGIVGMIIPNFYVGWLKNKRETDLNEQLPEFLNTLSNALRSGLSLQQSIDIATVESLDPVKWEFEKVLSDMVMGRTTEDSLNNLRDRTKNNNIDLLVNSINIQMDVGGNLSEVLDSLAATIRENAKLQRYFKSTVAQNKLSGIIIGLLPIGLAAILTMVNPEYMSPLFADPLGRLMVIGAVLMMGLGLFIIKKITELEV